MTLSYTPNNSVLEMVSDYCYP